MDIFFYLTHTLYAKVLIPIMVRLAEEGHRISVSKNKFSFLRYSPHRYANTPISNTFVNRSSFDYIADISGYKNEWEGIKEGIRFTFFNPKKCDVIIGTTKNLNGLKALRKDYPDKNIFAIGYQHMPFSMCISGRFKDTNLPEVCTEVFIKPNPFSEFHRFGEYIADHKLSFRGFPHLEKAYNGYYLKRDNGTKRYALVFHPGGYRGVITERGESKKVSYEKQKDFIKTMCTPILERGLIPVIKTHPLASRYHFKEDVLEIVFSLSKEDSDFSRVIVEGENFYKYVYESASFMVSGSSSIYELFSMGIKNVIIYNFFGRSRTNRFSAMKDIFINSKDEYKDFWKDKKEGSISGVYKKSPLLNKIRESYSALFTGDISKRIIDDMGLT